MTNLFRMLIASASIAVGVSLGATTATAQPVVLKGITPWQADYDLSKAFFIFQDLVNERLKGKVEVRYLGGPEITQPNDQFEALRNGVVDVLLGAAAYYRGEVPAAAAVQFTKRLPSELRGSGYFDLMRTLHAEKGVVYLANTAGGNKFRLYLTRPVAEPNLGGMKIRVSPVYLPMVAALGGTPVNIAPGEVYTALERSAIDGYGWTYTGIDVFGWHEQTKALVDHPFYSLDGAILVNKDVWDRLPDEVRKELAAIGVETEKRVEAFMAERLSAEDEKLRKLGIAFITFSDADAEKYYQTAYDAGWKDFLAKNKSLFEKRPELVDQLTKTGM